MKRYSMPASFENLPILGQRAVRPDPGNEAKLMAVEAEIHREIQQVTAAGRADASLNADGQFTALQRILSLVDQEIFLPLNSLYNPEENDNGSTAILKGLGKIEGRWALIVASDNKKLAGAWVPGQSENLLRASDTAKRLRIPLVYLLNCRGVKLDEQEKVYANRRGGGAPFYRNAELNQLGIPVIVGIWGTNPAGGGYHAISPTILIAHKKANMAVGGAGILSGMNPKGYIDEEGAQQIVEASAKNKSAPPGSIGIHYEKTGFFREVYAEEEGVIAAIRKYLSYLPAYHPDFFRVAEPMPPRFEGKELYSLLPVNTKKAYDAREILARLLDGSEFAEYKPAYGPEILCGMCRLSGFPLGLVANSGQLLMNYPKYRQNSVGLGSKLYREGLIKMSEFVTLCARDRLPIIWLQDTTGIDVGDEAEEAELLGLGQSLIYSIQNSDLPQMEITLRKGTAAAHYVLGGPQGEMNAFSLGTAATEINVMNGETACCAMYSRKLVKESKTGEDHSATIAKMNQMIQDYKDRSTPLFCARKGLVDEVVDLDKLRSYMLAFTEACYQNPDSICPRHQMILPRAIREYHKGE